MSADFPTLAEAMAIEQSKASQPALTGSKATLRDREDGTPPKPPPARSKVRALRDSSSFCWFRRQCDACSFAVTHSRAICAFPSCACAQNVDQEVPPLQRRQPFPIQGRIPPIRPWVEDDSRIDEEDAAEEQQAASKAAEEIEEETTLVYLQISQDKMGKDRIKMDRGDVVIAYTEAALDANLVEAIPDRGIGRAGPKGPYQVYASESDIDLLLSQVATLFVGQGDNKIMCSLSKRVFGMREDAEV